jgi:hypothetical protein
VRLSDEPGKTIRALIGDGRADELGRFDTDELVYLSECFDYLAWCSSEGELERVKEEK